jgi:hypothetical protein
MGELQIIGRIGEDEIDRSRRQGVHGGDAIAPDDAVGFHAAPGKSLWINA